MNAIEAVHVLKQHCDENHCKECLFGSVINAGSPLAFTVCSINVPAHWEIKDTSNIAADEDLQHVGYTDEQLGREK